MNMDSRGKGKTIPLLRSFAYAIDGIRTAIIAERNMRIHLLFSFLVIGGSFFFSITRMEWLFIILVISGMFALELINSAIERVVDLVTEEYHPLAKQAKDLAAGAVFLYAIFSVIIGIIVFFPYIRKLFL
ncbi:diacylglycerol kinase family protein [Neobacillus cucumis]|uniref:diacylglycerol kinase family protein n=1 Tax=Neobacillus cucumis TaxID=1740721 RepID=UPI0018DF241A|nr:diacylglycerol kinase family protein [Neobacillus cucumis]MBI0576386.1 diacylglycerol kinase family protein [Neobacillus cucumis]